MLGPRKRKRIRMNNIMNSWRQSLAEQGEYKVRGYIKPESSFRTLAEWKDFSSVVLEYQSRGYYLNPGKGEDSKALNSLIQKFYDFQLDVETERYELLTRKNVIDHIEDFANHRIWGFEREFRSYFDDISKLKFAFFYSRGDMEPYVLLDPVYTKMMHGTTSAVKTLKHYTTDEGVLNIRNSIDSGEGFDISSFTVANRMFFRKESNRVILFEGLVKAAFRSDVKSFAVDNGLRAANLFRFEYPGDDQDNICSDLDAGCNAEVRTSLWNEIIARPLKIIKIV